MLRHDSNHNSFDGDIGQQYRRLEQPLPGGRREGSRVPKAKHTQPSDALVGLLRLSVQILKCFREACPTKDAPQMNPQAGCTAAGRRDPGLVTPRQQFGTSLAFLAPRCEIPSSCEALKMVGFVGANAKIEMFFVGVFPSPEGGLPPSSVLRRHRRNDFHFVLGPPA